MARAARTERLRTVSGPEPFPGPDFVIREETRSLLAELRQAIQAKHKMRIGYIWADGESSERQVAPAGLLFWGNQWTLGAWCNLRRAVLPEFEVTHDVDKYMEAMKQEE